MPILIVTCGVAALLILVMRFRFNAFIALILVALGVGFATGKAPIEVAASIQKGVGETLGTLALILGFGAMLGAIIAESGAALVIARRLISLFGIKHLPWAMVLTGFIIGVPMFYSVAFLVIFPVIYSVAKETRLPILYVGIPMVSALSVTHGFLPPHPAPSAIVIFYHADMGLTLLYGLVIAVPTIVLAGVVFGKNFRRSTTPLPEHIFTEVEKEEKKLPGFSMAVLTALVPVLLMGISAMGSLFLEKDAALSRFFNFIGEPAIALLAAILFAAWSLGTRGGRSLKGVMDVFTDAVKPVATIMLIIAGGGAFKQVLVDGGISQYVVESMKGLHLSPLLLAWLIAAALRIALGSATVAALTAAGIVAPMVTAGNVSPELLVLATGAGSLACSQVNDTGFWLFKEYFNTSILDTLKSWTVMETIVSVAGLAMCLLLEQLV